MNSEEDIQTRLDRDLHTDPGILILAYPYARTWAPTSDVEVRSAWARVRTMDPAAIYIHIPFCRRKCTFCDFLSYYNRPVIEIARYLELLCQEIRIVAATSSHVPISAIHMGGGTPSLLSPDQMDTLLNTVRRHFVIQHGTQVTMEAYPDDEALDLARLTAYRAAGITRISYGIQFFDDALKRTVNRTDTTAGNLKLIDRTADAGFDDFNLDLMCGLPNQQMESWTRTVQQAVSVRPSHVCIFPVSVRHPGIPLYRKRSLLPSPDETRRMWNVAVTALLDAGYRRTTRHNFMRPGFKYRYEHMIAHLSPLIALGANSVGYSEDFIYRNHSNLHKYARAVESGEWPVRAGHEFLGNERMHNYAVRRIEYLGLDGDDFNSRFGKSIESVFAHQLSLLNDRGLCTVKNGDVHLTEDGVYFTAAVKRAFFHPSAIARYTGMTPDELTIERENIDPAPEGETAGSADSTTMQRADAG